MTDAAPEPFTLPPRPDIVISPEPTPEEFAALAAALLPLLDSDENDDGRSSTVTPAPPWRIAALREGVLGAQGGPRSGWGRTRAGWRG